MSYKVFFVEDEIVTREGIRDNVDWNADGFELCGEAPDGEMALPLVQATRPDVLITDIKMPFMDGLQLSRIVRERLPRTKIVILSGHDEFEYAQEAIKLGITEYLLKPVTVQDMHKVLQRVGAKITQEHQEQAQLRQLRDQVAENRAVLIERLLLKLLVGGITPSEAIEQCELVGLDLVARSYLAVVIRIASNASTATLFAPQVQQMQDKVSELTAHNPDVFLLRKDLQELVLILKGDSTECLVQDRDLLLTRIQQCAQTVGCTLTVGVGAPASRIADIGQSFLGALADAQRGTAGGRTDAATGIDCAALLKVDKTAAQEFLRCGVQADLNDFFDAFILPLGETLAASMIVKNYVLLELAFTAASFVQELGGEVDEVLPGLDHLETVLNNITTIDQFREQVQCILTAALAFRDCRAGGPHAGVIQQAREYIDRHYADPEISLHQVAAQVGHSPCHFSTVFGEENGTTFKEYLTELRIRRARELLRTTTLRSSDVADQVGYRDPHYFSLVFRKHTGLSPKEFRLQARQGTAK